MAHAKQALRVRTSELSRVPRYLQVASALRQRIRDGHWAVGEKIATLEQLESEFGVARVTIRQAVELLQSEGLLKSEQGRGTFVTKSLASERWLQLSADLDSLIQPIRRNTLRLFPVERPYPPKIDTEEGTPAEAYHFIHSLQFKGDEPYAVARVHVAKDLYDLAPEAFAKRVALVVLVEHPKVTIARAHQTLAVSSADISTAEHLQIPFGAPVVEARCIATDENNRVIYVGEITYRSDCVLINIELVGKRTGSAE